MKKTNKQLLSFITAFMFMFTLVSSVYPNMVQAYSNSKIFNDLRVGLVSMTNTVLTAVLTGSYTLNGTQQPSGTVLSIYVNNNLVNINGIDYSEVQLLPLSSSNLVTLSSGIATYKYQGDFLFKVSSGKVLPINTLDIESYLKGVVGYEMSDYYPLEALKAQAVAARNYALIKLGYEAAKGYDFDDTIMYQVYKGYNDKLKNAIRAVDETRFIVLLHNDKLVESVYSAWHGGYSEDAVNVWGNSVIYLKAKADSFENDPWPGGNRSFTNAQVDSTLKSTGWLLPTDTFISLDPASITGYTSGRVANINIIYQDSLGVVKIKSVTKDKTRSFLSFPSNLYTVSYDAVAGVYTFSGKGYGHGLGMSQIGAKNRAASGQTYEQILKFYYDDSYLQNLTPKASILSFNVSSSEIYTNASVNVNTISIGGSGQYLYRYQILRSGVVVLNTEFSSFSSLTYKALQSGSYEIVSYVKDRFSPLSFDMKQTKLLNVIDDVKYAPMTLSASINKSATIAGQPVEVSAAPSGGSGKGYLYKYELLSGNSVISSKDFSTDSSFSYTPSVNGSYSVNVYLKDAGLSASSSIVKSINFTAYKSPQIVTAKSTGKMLINTPVDMSADFRFGSPAGYTLKYQVQLNGKVIAERNLSSSSSFSFIPSSAGKYTVSLQVKDNISVNSIDAVKTFDVYIEEVPIKVSKLPIKSSMRGTDVKTVQTGLSQLGYKLGAIDGIFGSKTLSAAKSFQKSVKLKVTGIIDAATFNAINIALLNKAAAKTISYINEVKTFDTYIAPAKTSDIYVAPAPMKVSKLPIKTNMKGTDVKTVQTGLSKLGYKLGAIDGAFGPKTLAAVKSFQKSVKLKVTGIIDAASFNAMNNALLK